MQALRGFVVIGGLVVGAGFVLACAGAGLPGSSDGGGPVSVSTGQDGPEVYDGVGWTSWSVRSGKYRWDVLFDDQTGSAEWLGGQSEPFSRSGDDIQVPFPRGTAHLRMLDACHLGGRGPHPKEDNASPQLYKTERTWPPCDERDCTYGDLAFSVWRIHAREYKFDLSFDDKVATSAWLGEEPVPWSRSGDTVTIEFEEGTVTLTQLDRCHWAGTGPHPKEAGVTLDYRLNRSWPSCGCS